VADCYNNKANVDIKLRLRCGIPPPSRRKQNRPSTLAIKRLPLSYAHHCMDQSNSQFIGCYVCRAHVFPKIAPPLSRIVTPT